MTDKFRFDELTFCENIMGYATRYYKKYERFYHLKYQADELKFKAVLHAIYHYTLDLIKQSKKERGCFIKDIHRQLVLLDYKIPENYDYFCAQLKAMKKSSIQDVLEHGAKGKPRYRSRKFDPILIDYAEVIYSKGLYTYRQIYEKVKAKAQKKGFEELSLHKIKRHFAKTEVQNRLRPSRNGKEWFIANTAKQQHFSKPKFAGQLWEIDGSRLQIPFNNIDQKKIDFLTLFIILDVISSMILGYAHGLFESSQVVKNSFRRFFWNYDFMPLQIIRDGGSAFKKDFKLIEEIMTKRGVSWVVTHNPQGKAHIESFNKTFAQSICSYHKHFIGLGVTSTHIDSRITSKSKLKKTIGDRHKLGTYDEVVHDIDQLINIYQNTMFDGFESPKMRFDRLFNSNNVGQLSQADKTAMSGIFKSKKVSNSEIDIVHRKKQYFYQIPGIIGENMKEINVAYDTSKLDQVYLFKDNFDFLMTLRSHEIIPFMSSQRNSSQQNRYLKELAARENRYKKLINDVTKKEKLVETVFSNSPSFEVVKIHRNKRDEVEAQNEFTRSLLYEDYRIPEKDDNIIYPPNSYHFQPEQKQDLIFRKYKKNGNSKQ